MWSGGGVKKIKEFADSLTRTRTNRRTYRNKGHVTPIEEID